MLECKAELRRPESRVGLRMMCGDVEFGDDERIFSARQGCMPTDPTIPYRFRAQCGAAVNERSRRKERARKRERMDIERRTGGYIVHWGAVAGGLWGQKLIGASVESQTGLGNAKPFLRPVGASAKPQKAGSRIRRCRHKWLLYYKEI